ncbi:hypothetical protein V8E53_013847 [Lactarius tabidus]
MKFPASLKVFNKNRDGGYGGSLNQGIGDGGGDEGMRKGNIRNRDIEMENWDMEKRNVGRRGYPCWGCWPGNGEGEQKDEEYRNEREVCEEEEIGGDKEHGREGNMGLRNGGCGDDSDGKHVVGEGSIGGLGGWEVGRVAWGGLGGWEGGWKDGKGMEGWQKAKQHLGGDWLRQKPRKKVSKSKQVNFKSGQEHWRQEQARVVKIQDCMWMERGCKGDVE